VQLPHMASLQVLKDEGRRSNCRMAAEWDLALHGGDVAVELLGIGSVVKRPWRMDEDRVREIDLTCVTSVRRSPGTRTVARGLPWDWTSVKTSSVTYSSLMPTGLMASRVMFPPRILV
jgi:hypothetical protein